MASPNPNVEVELKTVCRQLGEGPHWDVATQTLIFVDIAEREIHRWNSTTAVHDVKHLGSDVGFVVPRAQGGYVGGVGHTFSRVEWNSPTVTTLYDANPGDDSFRFNDGKCDSKGRAWGGTVDWGTNDFVPGAGSLYTLGLDGSVSVKHSGLTISNGLAWTSDNRTMFLIDSKPKNIYAFDFDLDTGAISSERTAVTFPSTGWLPENSVPDGMTIDTDDKLWVAFYNGSTVARVDPETGTTLQKIHFPVTQTTSVSWGGRNLDELFVTSARQFSSDEFHRQPLAGSLFKVTGLGARGLPANKFQG